MGVHPSSATMSVNEESLRKVLQELETQAITSARAMSSTRQMIASKERERKLIALTKNELNPLSEARGDKVYKGVGKMFVMENLKTTINELNSREKDASEDITSLNKKLKYLENESAQAQAGLKEIFEHQRRPHYSASLARIHPFVPFNYSPRMSEVFDDPFSVGPPSPSALCTVVSEFPVIQRRRRFYVRK